MKLQEEGYSLLQKIGALAVLLLLATWLLTSRK